MASDIFIKLADIPGEATDLGYEGQIAVSSFGHSVSIPVDKNKAVGEVQHGHLLISKVVDKASPLLNQKCCVGQSIGEAVMTCLRAGGDHRVPYLVVKLQNAVISSVSVSGHGGDIATEQVSISYNKIDWEYKTPDSKLTKGNWNLMTVKAD
jgi:type VI secretion system secreted protein Hcp